jgi:hypothetical protein
VVAFTGTSRLSDVVDDVRFPARPWPPGSGEGLVHGGFADRTERLCSDERWLHMLGRHPDAIIAGHSLGGACAVLLASWASTTHPHVRPTVHTFGAPRLATLDFCERYRAQGLWERTFCHRAPCDPVPNVPPWLCHVGVEDVLPSMRTLYVQHTLGAYRLGLETGDEVVKD